MSLARSQIRVDSRRSGGLRHRISAPENPLSRAPAVLLLRVPFEGPTSARPRPLRSLLPRRWTRDRQRSRHTTFDHPTSPAASRHSPAVSRHSNDEFRLRSRMSITRSGIRILEIVRATLGHEHQLPELGCSLCLVGSNRWCSVSRGEPSRSGYSKPISTEAPTRPPHAPLTPPLGALRARYDEFELQGRTQAEDQSHHKLDNQAETTAQSGVCSRPFGCQRSRPYHSLL